VRSSVSIIDARCIRARAALSAAFDGEASSAEARLAASHLGGCPRCRQFAAQIPAITNELRRTVPLSFTAHA
jgi:predicted anti-sigma-YlaC factor YlaD